MRYVRHNARQNYHNAAGSRDDNYLTDLVANDISNVILKQRRLLLDGFKDAGIEVSPNASNRELARKIVSTAGTNKKLQHNLARLISFNNAQAQSKTFSAEGGIDPISQIAGAVNSVFGFFEAKQQSKNTTAGTQQKLMDLIMAKMEAAKAKAAANKTGIIIGGSIFILAIGGLIYYLKTKS